MSTESVVFGSKCSIIKCRTEPESEEIGSKIPVEIPQAVTGRLVPAERRGRLQILNITDATHGAAALTQLSVINCSLFNICALVPHPQRTTFLRTILSPDSIAQFYENRISAIPLHSLFAESYPTTWRRGFTLSQMTPLYLV